MTEIKEVAKGILSNLEGLIGIKVLNIGLDTGIFTTMHHLDGVISAKRLAEELDFDEKYLQHWLDTATAYNYVDADDSGPQPTYKLAKHMDKLLLNTDFPGYIGGFPGLFEGEELFDWFEKNLQSGERVWWEDASEEWIRQVGITTVSNYNRFIAKDFAAINGFEEDLKEGIKVLELASGTATGLVKLAKAYPASEFYGLDGDEKSIEIARDKVQREGVSDRVSFIHSWFEDLDRESEFDAVLINASMHECRDIEKVTQNIFNALKPGGIFIISDIPYPTEREEFNTTRGKIMLGINFWELQIDDTLLSGEYYKELLEEFNFRKVSRFNSTPTQCIIYGYKS